MEPEEAFEPFRESGDESVGVASSCYSINKRADSSELDSSFNLIQSPSTTSTFSRLSPQRRAGASGKLNGNTAYSGENTENLDIPHREIGSAGSPPVMGRSTQFIGGFSGGKGIGGRPSSAHRLSLVDKKWLERCQVFGELGADEKPGAGNKHTDTEKRGEEENGRETEGSEMKEDKIIEHAGKRHGAKDLGGGECDTVDRIDGNTQQSTKKYKGRREEKDKRKGGEDMVTGLMPPPTSEDDGQNGPESKVIKKRGRKRQREGEDVDGETREEGGVKKKQRNGKKKEESCDVNHSPAEGGGKKRRGKKKEDEDGGEEKKVKAPKKVRSKIYFSTKTGHSVQISI